MGFTSGPGFVYAVDKDGTGVTVAPDNVFTGADLAACSVARDAFFVNNPDRLVDGMYIILNPTGGEGVLQKREGNAWVNNMQVCRLCLVRLAVLRLQLRTWRRVWRLTSNTTKVLSIFRVLWFMILRQPKILLTPLQSRW